jgi:hypothetical protein
VHGDLEIRAADVRPETVGNRGRIWFHDSASLPKRLGGIIGPSWFSRYHTNFRPQRFGRYRRAGKQPTAADRT